MTSVCPQRIIKEAIRLLERADFAPGSDDDEAAGSALHELAELERRLYKAGITKIDIDGRT
jgi:hypothetical protein